MTYILFPPAGFMLAGTGKKVARPTDELLRYCNNLQGDIVAVYSSNGTKLMFGRKWAVTKESGKTVLRYWIRNKIVW